MRKTLCAVLFAVALLTALPVYAQNPNYDLGPVWRVTYYHLNPGQSEPFWKDFREHVKPSYDALKKEGLISDYKVWTNVTTDGRTTGTSRSACWFRTGQPSINSTPTPQPSSPSIMDRERP